MKKQRVQDEIYSILAAHFPIVFRHCELCKCTDWKRKFHDFNSFETTRKINQNKMTSKISQLDLSKVELCVTWPILHIIFTKIQPSAEQIKSSCHCAKQLQIWRIFHRSLKVPFQIYFQLDSDSFPVHLVPFWHHLGSFFSNCKLTNEFKIQKISRNLKTCCQENIKEALRIK